MRCHICAKFTVSKGEGTVAARLAAFKGHQEGCRGGRGGGGGGGGNSLLEWDVERPRGGVAEKRW